MTTRFEPQTSTATYYWDRQHIAGIEVKHVYDLRGDHRLEIVDKISSWEVYGEIVTLEYHGIIFAGSTEYWWSTLPEIFTIIPLKQHDVELLSKNVPPIQPT